jgi:DNA-directed RNA polymerase specialized sigma24 family protein
VTRRYVDEVYRYALAISGNGPDAEDVAHTALAEEYWVAQGRPEPRSRRKRLIDIAHEVLRRRFDAGTAEGPDEARCAAVELALTRRADGRLPLRRRRPLQAHLRACPDCAALAIDLEAQREALRELARLPVPGSLGNSRASLRAGRHLNP